MLMQDIQVELVRPPVMVRLSSTGGVLDWAFRFG